MRACFLLLMLLAGALPAADLAPPDKRPFSLFHPTPAEWMREMSTDRPDKTESPFTVDAGHVQMEMDLASFTRDHDTAEGRDVRVRSWAIAPVNLKLGLNNNLDFQLMMETWNHVRTEDRIAGTKTRQSGFGDIIPRVKLNLWGNDGGRSAFAVMPFVKIPSRQHGMGSDAVEGGIILPLAFDLPAGFSLGLMAEVDLIRNAGNSRYHPEFVNTATLSHDLIGNLGGYVELFSQVSSERGARWIGTVDLGLTYGISRNVRLDGGVNLGVTKAADDWNPFLGLSVRF